MNARAIIEDMPDQPEPEQEPGQETVQIGEILGVLPSQVQAMIMRILNTPGTDVHTEIAITKELKALLRPYQRELDRVGILADYFAYMLLAVRQQLWQ